MAEKRAGRRDSSNKYSSHLLIHVLICKPGTSPLVATAQDQRPVCAGSQSNNNLCHPRACDGRGCQRRFDMASGRKDSDFSTGCTVAIDGLDLVGRAAVVAYSTVRPLCSSSAYRFCDSMNLLVPADVWMMDESIRRNERVMG